uniref:Protein kinase domain-containing protein n=1 Tax=Macrostomum lignano TaxID=282301 RepID=A0A1I8JPD1_9PLAT
MRSGQVKLGDFGVAQNIRLHAATGQHCHRHTRPALLCKLCLKKEVLLPALLKHISAEPCGLALMCENRTTGPALRFSASFRLAFQEVAAIQQASPASAGQKRPGSAPRPSSASSKRVVAAAAAAYPAAPLSPYAQKLGGGGGGGNESASLAAARRRDQEQRLAAVRPRQRAAQAADAAAAAEGTRAGRSKTPPAAEALINAAQTPTPPPAAAVAASPSPSPSPSPRGGDYAAYHAALDNLAKEAQHRPRQSPQPQQQQLHPGVAVPSSSPSASPTPPPAADNQSERAQRLLEDYWNGNGWQLGLKRKASVWAPRRPLIRFHPPRPGLECRSDLRQSLTQNWLNIFGGQPLVHGGVRLHRIRMQSNTRPAISISIRRLASKACLARRSNSSCTRPAAVAVEETYLRRLEEVRRRNQRERQQLGEDVQQERHIGASSSNSAAASADASNGDDQEAQKRRKKESILRYINRKARAAVVVPQQQPPPPDAGVRSAWDSIDCDVDRLLTDFRYVCRGADGGAEQCAPNSARLGRSRRRHGDFCVDWATHQSCPAPWVDSDSLPEREVDGEGEVDGKADSESVKSPAHSDLSQVETAEAPHSRAGRASPSISDASASTGHSLLDQVAFEPDAERPQKEASANFVDDEKPGKSGATAGKGGSLKDFALSAATAAAATDDEVEAAEQLLLSSLTLEEAEELAEVERSFHRVLNDPEPSPSDAKDGDTEAEADDAQCSRTLKQALTSGKFDSPKSLLRTCSLPDLVDGADAGASGEISADSTATVVSVEAASLPSRPRQRPASSSAAASRAAAAVATPDDDDVVVLD